TVCNCRMKVYIPKRTLRFQPLFDFALTSLLPDSEKCEIWSNVLVDFDAKCLPNPQAKRTAQDEQHPLSWLFPTCQPRHHIPREAGCILLRFFYYGHVDELVVPLAGINLLSLLVHSGSHHHLHPPGVVINGFR